MVARHSWTRTAGAVDVVSCEYCGNFDEELASARQECEREQTFPYSPQLEQLARDWVKEQFPDLSENELRSIYPNPMEIIKYYVLS